MKFLNDRVNWSCVNKIKTSQFNIVSPLKWMKKSRFIEMIQCSIKLIEIYNQWFIGNQCLYLWNIICFWLLQYLFRNNCFFVDISEQKQYFSLLNFTATNMSPNQCWFSSAYQKYRDIFGLTERSLIRYITMNY